MTTTRTLVFACGLLIASSGMIASPGSAIAGGFASARFGGEGASPASDSVTSIYFNPAGLAQGSGTRFYVEGLLIWRTASYDRPADAINNVLEPGEPSGGTPQEAVTANSGKATLANFLVSPFLGAVTDFGVDNLAVGVAFYAPFGGQAAWSKNDEYEGDDQYPGAIDGVQRWAAIDGVIRSLYLSGSVAYKLPGPKLSFGLAVNVVRSEVDTVRARLASGTDDLVSSNGGITEGRARITVSGTNLAFGGGVQWEPTEQLLVGASYQSQPGLGEMKLRGELLSKFGAAPDSSQDIFFSQSLPDIVRLGVRYRMSPKVELRISGDYTRWSVLEDQCLVSRSQPDHTCKLDKDGGTVDSDGDGDPDSQGVIINIHRGWQDTFGVRGGGSYWISPQLELGGSLAFDGNAVPDENLDPALMDMNKLVATAAVTWSGVENLRLMANYTQVLYLSRDVEPRMEPNPHPSRVPSGAGKYSQLIGLLSLGAQYGF